MEPRLADAIAIHLSMKWDPAEVIVFRNAPAEGELDGLLLVGANGPAPDSEALLIDTVDLSLGADGSPILDDILFQADAKLGRLTNSHLAKQSTRSFLTKEATFSRRELFAGATKGFRRFSNLPVILSDSCESKLGCTRCIDICPSKALQVKDGFVALSDAECTKCGMCAAICPTGAVQMPEFSDEALFGLLDEIDVSSVPTKTLVLTCDRGAIGREPWMVVEEVSSVGMLGPRQIAAAAGSSLGGVAVVCADGKCIGKDSAKTAVGAISGSISPAPRAASVIFMEGRAELGRLSVLHRSSKARPAHPSRTGDRWKDFVSDLTALLSADSPTSGLGLTQATIAESCTLCGSCGKACPHGSLRLDEEHIYFSALSCTGCGLCVKVCPEHSITLSPSSGKLSEIMQGGSIYQDELVKCARCGAPIGSAKFVNKVTSLLGPDARLVKYCPACKKQVLVETLFGGIRRD